MYVPSIGPYGAALWVLVVLYVFTTEFGRIAPLRAERDHLSAKILRLHEIRRAAGLQRLEQDTRMRLNVLPRATGMAYLTRANSSNSRVTSPTAADLTGRGKDSTRDMHHTHDDANQNYNQASDHSDYLHQPGSTPPTTTPAHHREDKNTTTTTSNNYTRGSGYSEDQMDRPDRTLEEHHLKDRLLAHTHASVSSRSGRGGPGLAPTSDLFRFFSAESASRILELARARKQSRDVAAARELYAWLFQHLRTLGPLPDADEALYRILHTCLDEMEAGDTNHHMQTVHRLDDPILHKDNTTPTPTPAPPTTTTTTTNSQDAPGSKLQGAKHSVMQHLVSASSPANGTSSGFYCRLCLGFHDARRAPPVCLPLGRRLCRGCCTRLVESAVVGKVAIPIRLPIGDFPVVTLHPTLLEGHLDEELLDRFKRLHEVRASLGLSAPHSASLGPMLLEARKLNGGGGGATSPGRKERADTVGGGMEGS